jgi:predicted dehydrogenase
MTDRDEASRRDFLKLGAAAFALGTAARTLEAQAPAPAAAAGCGKVPPGEKRVGLATIGLGGQGTADTKAALKTPGVELVAVADLYDGRLARAKEAFCPAVVTTRDYQEILARSDVDAVIIGTPDHWHARIAIEAMEAGKDVYVEKPMVQRIDDGLKVIQAQRKTGRILQVGSQRVSSILSQKAKELLASGAIGELNLVEAAWNRNSPIGAWQYTIPPDASPETVDWERFLGPAPKRPFDAARFFRWRNYDDYGTGVAGDLFVHLFSGLHFVTNSLGPTRVMATGGLRHWKDGRDAADVLLALMEYPKTPEHPEFTLSLKVNFADGGGGGEVFRLVGSQGVISMTGQEVTLTRQEPEKAPGYSIETFPKAMQEAFTKEYNQKYPEAKQGLRGVKEERYRPPQGYSDLEHHTANFVQAVRNRTPVVEDAEFGLRAAGPALLCDLSLKKKKAFEWDPKGFRVVV